MNKMPSPGHIKLNQQRQKNFKKKINYPFSHCEKSIFKPRVSGNVKALVKSLIKYKDSVKKETFSKISRRQTSS